MNRRSLLTLRAFCGDRTGHSAGFRADMPQRSRPLHLPSERLGVDIGARLIAEKLSDSGASRSESRTSGRRRHSGRSPPIGAKTTNHVLMMATTSTFTGASIFARTSFPYELRDLVPIARSATQSGAGGRLRRINTLDEFIERAKKEQTGKLNYAGTTGAVDFVVFGLLKQPARMLAKVTLPRRRMQAWTIRRRPLQLYVEAYAIRRSQVQAGKVTIIAITKTAKRPPPCGVPTAKEAAIPGLGGGGGGFLFWVGFPCFVFFFFFWGSSMDWSVFGPRGPHA